MFPQQDLLPNQFLLPLRLILKTLAGSTEAPADEGADYGCHTPVESIAPVSSFLSLSEAFLGSLLPRVTWMLPTLVSLNMPIAWAWVSPLTDFPFTVKISSPARENYMS